MRKEKPLLLEGIKDLIDASQAMIVTRYTRLEPNVSWQFREAIAKKGSTFEVVPKRVFLKAATLSGVKLDEALMQGHVGVVFVNQADAMAPAKAMFEFSEANGQIFEVLCGSIEGKIVPGSELEMLSKLPGIDEMRSTMIALFTSPMSQMLSVVEAKVNEQNAS
jgi:large subunit ribosomal protein L10